MRGWIVVIAGACLCARIDLEHPKFDPFEINSQIQHGMQQGSSEIFLAYGVDKDVSSRLGVPGKCRC